MTSGPTPWVCAQLGSREHYAIPRVLHEDGRLDLLLTDYWSGGRGAARASGHAARMAQRYHPALATARVEHLGWRRLVFDGWARIRRQPPGAVILRRNAWFQRHMLARLRRDHLERLRARPGVFFSYSYAARDLARFFKSIGWRVVLGQIDPGVREEEIVAAEAARRPDVRTSWTPFPPDYWRLWRDECAISDVIAVNSTWSADALVASGIEAAKIAQLPLAFPAPTERPAPRLYPAAFSAARPLRVLFLGQIVLRKGAHLALDAARLLDRAPVEWHFVGPAEITCPPDLLAAGRVRWSGPVSRADTARLYSESDVFLLPTLSDGFALTQLEAQARGLPVLASRFCGAVVRDGVNGWLIDPLDAAQIATVIQRCLDRPEQLAALAARSEVPSEYTLAALRGALDQLAATARAH